MKRLRKEWKKDVSVVMTALLVCGSVGVPAEAKEIGGFIRENGLSAVQGLEPEITTTEVKLSDQDKKQLEKEETVYVIANADGSPEKLIVSDWLKNAMGSEVIEDATELKNIVNVKGDESFKQKENSLGVWDAAGNDIYYQGNIQKELPVDMKVTYHLNGKEISPDELAGQSGKVTIRFDYTNRQKESVMVGEKEEELYVPFVLLTSMVLDNESFRNVEVSNGKIINDGERTIVMGYAMPGLKDNLDIGSEDFDVEELDIPEYVEMSADVTDFELATTLTVATNEIFGDMDIDTQEKMDELSGDMDDLEEAMNELMDGTAELYDGVLELSDGTDELTDGINELDDGAGELNDGARELRDGAKELYDGTGTLKSGVGELVAGIVKLSAGLEQLTASNQALVKGAEDVFKTLLASATQQIRAATGGSIPVPDLTIDNYSQVINGIIKTLGGSPIALQAPTMEEQEAEEQEVLQNDPNEIAGDSEKQAEQVEEDKVLEETDQNLKTEPEEMDTVDSAPSDVNTETPDAIDIQPEDTSEPVNESEEDPAACVEEKDFALVGSSTGADSSQAQNAGADALIKLKAQLDSYNEFYQGLKAYTEGVATASQGAKELLAGVQKLDGGVTTLEDGAKKLKDGASELKDGTGELKDGTHELRDGGQELKDGVGELRDGSLELKDGTVEFNDEGIQKLLDMFNGDLQELSDRMDAVKSAAKGYQSFSGISDGVQGNVRFIYKTAAIEK